MTRPLDPFVRTCTLGFALMLSAGAASATPATPIPHVPEDPVGTRIDSDQCDARDVDLAATSDGFAAVWADGPFFLRAFDQRQAPLSEEGDYTAFVVGRRAQKPTLALDSRGRGVVVWYNRQEGNLYSARVRAGSGNVDGGPLLLGSVPDPGSEEIEIDLIGLSDETFLVADNLTDTAVRFNRDEILGAFPLQAGSTKSLLQVGEEELWLAYVLDLPTSPPSAGVFLERRRLADGVLLERLFERTEGFKIRDVALAQDGRGRVSLAWTAADGVRLQRFDDLGTALGATLELAPSTAVGVSDAVRLTTDEEGNRLVTWTRPPQEPRPNVPEQVYLAARVFSRAVTADDTVAGPIRLEFDFRTNVPRYFSVDTALSGPSVVSVAASAPGLSVPVTQPPCILSDGVFVHPVNLGDERYLLLRDGRFRVEVDWQDPFNGGTGIGHAVPGTDDAGSFWFFNPDNKEIEVKILDGRAVNGHFWVFAAGLSNVGYQITVTDQRTGLSKTFDNPPEDFGNFIDTGAFPGP